MKKVKLNFDKRAIKAFLIEHAEKVALGAVAAVFMLIVLTAFGSDKFGLDKSPAGLVQESKWAEDHILRTELEDVEFQIPTVNLSLFKEEHYRHAKKWHDWVLPPHGLRPEPPLFNVVELRASANAGPFSIKNEELPGAPGPASVGAGGRTEKQAAASIRGQRWVVLTGLVQFRKQFEAYADCFRDTAHKNSLKDVVEYCGYWVERAEITGRETIDDPNWTTKFVSVTAIEEAGGRWGSLRTTLRVVDGRLTDKKLTFPLGPLAGGIKWDKRVAHEPEIPVRRKGGATPRQAQPGTEAEDPDGDQPEDIWTEKPNQPTARIGSGLGQNLAQKGVPEFKLFRFFDFTVQPGKRYCYRVQLVLTNPNVGVAARFLEDPASAKALYLSPLWDDQVVAVTVPRSATILALSVAAPPPTRIDEEPKGRLKVVKWVEERGIETSAVLSSVTRGKLINFQQETSIPGSPDPVLVDYFTGAIALDLRGGSRLAGDARLTDPGEFLLLDAEGTLVVHNELDDLDKTQRNDQGASSAKPPKTAGRLPNDLNAQLGLP